MILEKPFILLNHSCEPNAFIRGKNELVALKDIRTDEEIAYDYSTSMWEDSEVMKKLFGTGLLEMKCNCGSINCRKIIKQFYELANDVQKRYLELKIVQDFILEKKGILLPHANLINK